MAVIINTAMESFVRVTCSSFWCVKCDEFLSQILRIFVRKWVAWMQFAPAVVMHYGVYEFGCCKVDKSWTKETCKLAACLGIFNAEKTKYVVVHNGVAHALLYLTTLQNDIKVDKSFYYSCSTCSVYFLLATSSAIIAMAAQRDVR